MKFLLIAGYAGSIISFRGKLLEALQDKGLIVHVAAPELTSNNSITQQLREKKIKVHDIPINRTGMNPLKDCISIVSLFRLMRQVQPDYILGYTIKPVIYGTIAAVLSKVPRRFALITGLGQTFQENKHWLTRFIIRWLYRVSLKKVECVFFQNPDDRSLFISLNIIEKGKQNVVVNGSGVDLQHYYFCQPPRCLNFLLVSRLIGEKGVREFVKAAEQIKKQVKNVKFSIVGWIDNNPNAIKSTELIEWADNDIIKYYGRLDDVRPALRGCSVFVLPSYYREGVPRTILEAMAMGRAIITTDTPGCRETVINGENGYLVATKSVDELVKTMKSFIENPASVIVMGERSRKIAEQKYDVHKINRIMLEVMGI